MFQLSGGASDRIVKWWKYVMWDFWPAYILWNKLFEWINASITSHVYLCFWLKKKKHLSSTLNEFQLHNTVLSTIVTTLYSRSSEFIHLGDLPPPFYQHLPTSPTSQPCKSLFQSLFLWVRLFFFLIPQMSDIKQHSSFSGLFHLA